MFLEWIHTLVASMSRNALVVWNKCDIWSLSDSNGSQTHSHLGHKRTLNHLAKLAANLWVFVYELISCGFDSRHSHWNRNYIINYKLWIVLIISVKKNTYIWDNLYLYLKMTWPCLTDYDRNAMYWKSTSTYAKGIALTPTTVFDIYVFI